jgi:hypothetical protein
MEPTNKKEPNIRLNIIFGNQSKHLEVNTKVDFKDFIYEIFKLFACFDLTDKTDEIKNELLKNFNKTLYITFVSKHINEQNWDDMKVALYPNATIFVSTKLRGGLVPPIVTVLALLGLLSPLLGPIRVIFETIKKFIEMIVMFANMFIKVLKIIPLIFDPPAFIDDVMIGVSWGINKIFSRAMDSITESAKSPEKDDTDTSPFGENGDQGRMTCADPTLGMILLLVVCPPLAIFYKMGIAGMVSAIICGVLCVKLYYFPGLLFAILHVLC